MMGLIGRKLGLIALMVAFAPGLAAAAETASGDLKGVDGASLGSVTVTEAPAGVILRVQVKGISPGWHGMHFHETGDCAAPKFSSAGGHVHATAPVLHGFLTPDANDAGDLPNIHVAEDGTATVELYSTLVSLKPGADRPALLDENGAALVIHANPDDYQSQPIGGAGDRIACAVLR
ncbi:superoxide dismutase[Cu-Zn] [Paenirhodobacter sp.]|uniref:superoxide dismutase[Cu-Zn] n=1 Tax=Paenirhodobacter sp. TaxID=1965326 RepID=UPI003B3E6177